MEIYIVWNDGEVLAWTYDKLEADALKLTIDHGDPDEEWSLCEIYTAPSINKLRADSPELYPEVPPTDDDEEDEDS